MIPISKPYLTEDEAASAHDTILSGWVTQGPKVEEFEKKFCEYTGAEFAIAVSNCTTALHLAMIVSGIGRNDEVICPSMSYIATANCIRYTGAVPVFAEINPITYNIDAGHAEKLINKKTKAVLIAHQIGLPADIDAFRKLCENHSLKLIEDAACAAGSSYKGKKIGSHSELVCFSFHPRKVITTGEGGMITTNNEDYYDRLKILRQHGMSVNAMQRHIAEKQGKVIQEDHIETGYNYRMTDIQAAIGIKQLKKLDWIVNERRKIALRYISELKDINCIRLPDEEEGYFSNFQSFSIYLKENSPLKRNELIVKLNENGIASKRGIMTSHRETAYKKEYSKIKLPISENTSDNSLLIPLFIPMSEEEINFVITTLRRLLS
ncbi:MAG: UDP-4-amino-4-deoxy-L-arabinose--oxoglutarate aminotransferase [Ignavibacteria bacterium]|nr:UDP-4-amino-4-deoxy-L-arabinose--oxoglutarate aminotransferase [Ignavibacteria bacterium]